MTGPRPLAAARRGRRFAPVLALAALALGCEPDARNDANLFLDRIQRIDLDDPLETRRTRVASLATLPVEHPQVWSARDACVDAHQAIIEAEESSARARGAFEGYDSEDAIPVVERQRIEREIQASTRAVERSRGLFSRCHRLTRDLELRYRHRTRSR